jgi:hypothetical protein
VLPSAFYAWAPTPLELDNHAATSGLHADVAQTR